MAAQAAQPLEECGVPRETIAELAYELWLRRGSPIGTDQEDWFQAELMLRAMMAAESESAEEPRKNNVRHRKARRAT